jgi:hypothetical protein
MQKHKNWSNIAAMAFAVTVLVSTQIGGVDSRNLAVDVSDNDQNDQSEMCMKSGGAWNGSSCQMPATTTTTTNCGENGFWVAPTTAGAAGYCKYENNNEIDNSSDETNAKMKEECYSRKGIWNPAPSSTAIGWCKYTDDGQQNQDQDYQTDNSFAEKNAKMKEECYSKKGTWNPGPSATATGWCKYTDDGQQNQNNFEFQSPQDFSEQTIKQWKDEISRLFDYNQPGSVLKDLIERAKAESPDCSALNEANKTLNQLVSAEQVFNNATAENFKELNIKHSELFDRNGVLQNMNSKVFSPLRACGDKVRILELQRHLSDLPDFKDNPDLQAKKEALSKTIANYVANPEKLSSTPGSFQGDPMQKFYMAMDELRRAGDQARGDRNICEQVAQSGKDIQYFIDGKDDKNGPQRTAEMMEMAKKALEAVAQAQKENTPEACDKAMQSLQMLGKKAFGGGQGQMMPQGQMQFFKEDDLFKKNLTDDLNDTSQFKGMSEAQIKAYIDKKFEEAKQQIFAHIDEKIASQIMQDPTLAKTSSQFSDLAGRIKSDEFAKSFSDSFSNQVRFLSEDDLQERADGQSVVADAISSVVEKLPADWAKNIPIDVIKIVASAPLSADAQTKITDEASKTASFLASLTEKDKQGNITIISGKEDIARSAIEDFFKTLKDIPTSRDNIDSLKGTNPIFALKDGERLITDRPWYGDAAEAAFGEKLINGTGDGRLAAEETFTVEQAFKVIASVTNNGKENPDSANGLKVSDWAKGYVGGIIDSGAFTLDEVKNFNLTGTINREQLAELMVKSLRATDSEFAKLNFGPCVLDNVASDVTCSSPRAEYLDILYKLNIMTGQGEADANGKVRMDPKGAFNRGQGFKVMVLGKRLKDELAKSGAEIIQSQIDSSISK